MTASQSSAPITDSLNRWTRAVTDEGGDGFELIYEKLRKIASRQLEKYQGPFHLQTTEVLHEAYLRVAAGSEHKWRDRAHFFAYCTTAMRHVLVDLIRERTRTKRGSGRPDLSWEDVAAKGAEAPKHRRESQRLLKVLAVHEALRALADIDPDAAHVVELRYFGGLMPAEIASVLGISSSTAQRRWRVARAWLFERLGSPA